MLYGIYFIKHYFFRFIHEYVFINGQASVIPYYCESVTHRPVRRGRRFRPAPSSTLRIGYRLSSVAAATQKPTC